MSSTPEIIAAFEALPDRLCSEDAADVVVVGGGLAGLSAANRCAEHGLRVTVLERGEAERYPCNSRFAMGFVNVAMEDIARGPAMLRQAIERACRGEADPALATVLAEEAGPAVAWLRRQGVRFIRGGLAPPQRRLLAPPVPLRAGLHWPGRGADMMMRTLAAALERRGGRLRRGVRAQNLMLDDRQRCVGVVAQAGEREIRFHAPAVIIADGGFQADADLLRRFVTARPERLLQRNAGSGRGDGVRMAEAAGAALTAMDRFYGHVQCRDALTDPGLWPYPTIDFPITAGIAVDARGVRFADEGRGGIFMANAIARLDDPLSATAIFDHATWTGRARAFLLPTNPHLVKAGGTIHLAGSLAALAAKAGLPARELAATVEAFNRALDQNTPTGLTPMRSTSPFTPVPIRVPPFYAVPLCAGITYTMGGIAIDAECRVRRREGGVIPGLFAAGSATGGHEGGSAAGYTGGLSKALVFGLRAADTIAADLARRAAA